MQIAVTFRHMEVSNPIRDYAEEKISRVKKYIDEPIDAQVVLSVAKKIRHSAVVTLTAKGITIKGSEETGDMYAAIDAVVDKIERQLKRYREKIKDHKPHAGKERKVSKSVLNAQSIDEFQPDPEIIQTDSYEIKPMANPPSKGPKRPHWMTIPELRKLGIAPDDASYHFSTAWRKAHPNSKFLGYDRGHMCHRRRALARRCQHQGPLRAPHRRGPAPRGRLLRHDGESCRSDAR